MLGERRDEKILISVFVNRKQKVFLTLLISQWNIQWKFCLLFHHFRKKNNSPFTLVKLPEKRKSLEWIFLISCYSFFFSLPHPLKGRKKCRLCKKRTGGNMSMEFSCLAHSLRKNFFKDKRLLNMRNTSEFLPLHELFLFSFIIYRLFPRLSSNRKRSKKNLEIFHVPWKKKSMMIRPGVEENLCTLRWLVNFSNFMENLMEKKGKKFL